MYETLCFEVDGPVAELRLNRPAKLNAIDRLMIGELEEAIGRVREDEALRVLVVAGSGRGFSAGADLNELAAYESTHEPLDHIERIQRAYNALEDLPKPTIAAIHGFAYGGGLELALSCDLRVVSSDAKLGVPEVTVGLLPGAGGTQRLSNALPPAVAKRMIYLGDPLSADEALRHGLVNEVVPEAELRQVALDLARRLAELPPLPIRIAKLLVHGASQPLVRGGIEAERQGIAFLFATEDRREGTRAFVEKRKPRFQGR